MGSDQTPSATMRGRWAAFRAISAALTAMFVSACGSTTPTPEATETAPSNPENASVTIVGEPQTVYDWTTDRCADDMLPDLPVRAFRDAGGKIQLNVSFTRSYRLVGSDFDSLAPDCQVTLASANDPDPSHYQFKEWVGATYTSDGQTVYALIHNEWYGDEASRWDAARDFGGTQGAAGWRYQARIGSTYQDLTYDAAQGRWQGPQQYCQIGRNWAHPDLGCDATRTWVSPISGTVTVAGTVSDQSPGGGNGVVATVLNGNQELWSATIDNGDAQGEDFNLQVPVRQGDQLHFRVDARGDNGFDTTLFSPKIDVGPPPCPSAKHEDCLMMSVTEAVSTDRGATFTQAPAPDSLVAVLPYTWTPDAGHYAMWQPSNIVKSPRDGFYYALVQIDRRPRGESGFQGMCLIRTKSLGDAKSWRAWDGTGFDLRFVDPYHEIVDSATKQTCSAVSQPTVGSLSYSLTYNSYLDRFVAVGHDIFRDPPGFYYSLSEDLVHWSPKQLLMPADLVQNTNFRAPYLAYPSLIDHDSSERNFDVSGQSPYLYFTRVNNTNPLDFDLLRVQVRFTE